MFTCEISAEKGRILILNRISNGDFYMCAAHHIDIQQLQQDGSHKLIVYKYANS